MKWDRQTVAARAPGTYLLAAASVLLLGLAAAQGYVSWKAQFTFIDAAKHSRLPSALEAVGLDTGAVIFALLGLAHARMGRPAAVERTLNLACAFGSMAMNLLGADLASPRSIAVYVLPALLYAACSDRLIATAGHLAGQQETSLWKWAGVTLLYGLRACLAFPSTARGLRLRLLELTPLPGPVPATPDTPPDTPDTPLAWADNALDTPADTPDTPVSEGVSVPSIRQLMKDHGVGQPKARQIQQEIRAGYNGHALEENRNG